ncbi:MAG: hypothetical protein ACR2PR_07155 [Pseudohongiellaceae bacterium]
MSIVAGIKAFLGGGTGKEIVGFIRDRWPAKMSESEAAELELAVEQIQHKRDMDVLEYAADQDKRFNERTIAMEGTAKDLQAIPFLGPVVIFARGMFRPVFAYFTLYLDSQWFLTDTTAWTEQQNTAMIVINIIVLVFFFGERTVKNLMPLIAQAFGRQGVI